MNKQKILIPLDGSEFSREIVGAVQKLFRPEDVELILFEAIDPEAVPFMEGDIVSASDMVASVFSSSAGEGYKRRVAEKETHRYYRDEAMRHQHEGVLTDHAKALTTAGYSVKTKAEIGDAVEWILTCARTAGVDLIAMATHGRSGLSKLVMGSVAERVLHESSVPVLLVRPES